MRVCVPEKTYKLKNIFINVIKTFKYKPQNPDFFT